MYKRLLWGVLFVFIGGQVAHADGMVWLTKTAVDAGAESTDVLPRAQRALFQYVQEDSWPAPGIWELTIQPQFERPESNAVWTIPFSSCPEVEEGDGALLQQMDLLTSPVLVDACVQECECELKSGLCVGAATSDGLPGTSTGVRPTDSSGVNVWEEGDLGPLEYVVLSAEGGDDVVTWLNENGYYVDPLMEQYASDDANAGTCYFAARLNERVGPDHVIPAVKFRFSGLKDPSYPMRLTRLGMPGGGSFDLKLFVAIPYEPLQGLGLRSIRPMGRDADMPDCFLSESNSIEVFENCMDGHFQSDSPGALALTWMGNFGDRVKGLFSDGVICHPNLSSLPPLGSDCVSVYDLFEDAPADWSEGLRGFSEVPHLLYRYEARMDAKDMLEDIVLESWPTEGSWFMPCDHDNDCVGYFNGYLKGGMQGTAFHGVCRELDGTKRCTTYCHDAEECHQDWECQFIENVYSDPDASVRACAPKDGAPTPEEQTTLPSPEYVEWFRVRIEHDCGLDCDDVCDGKLPDSDAMVYQSIPGSGVASPSPMHLFFFLLFVMLVLWTVRRNRRHGPKP